MQNKCDFYKCLFSPKIKLKVYKRNKNTYFNFWARRELTSVLRISN